MNEKKIRALFFIIAAALHLAALLLFVIDTESLNMEAGESARVMKLTDLSEIIPIEPEIPVVEAIAETMIETDIPPVQEVLGAGVFLVDNFLPMHQLSVPPHFDPNEIMADLVYPPIALRAGIEGRVILELFVDRSGVVQRIVILQENPPDRGFGEAAVRAFTGRRGTPAAANGEPVSARYRYPVTFRIR